MICLTPQLIKDLKAKLISGEIKLDKLGELSSEERRATFSFLGEELAKEVNAKFESKLLLKNQQQGIINWAKEVAGLKPEVKKDILSRVEKMTEVLSPKDEQAFLEDLVAHKLNTTVTMEEAGKITELAKAATEKKANLTPENRLEYGRALVEFQNYVKDLKAGAKKISLAELKANPLGTAAKAVSNLSGLAKSLKASLDNSVIGRQGLKTLFTHPSIWLKNSIQSFKDIINTFGGKEVMNEVKADVLSRENALNGLYGKEKLAVGVTEESFPTQIQEKVPVLGRAFKASEQAFTAFQYRTRADVFDKLVEIAKKTDADITGIGKVANSLTGRGTFGQRAESAASIANNVFFSPRFLKSNIDLLTAHLFDSGISSFARKQAAVNLLKVTAGVAGILTIANALKPGSVETDPRSADFGKIKIGDTRFDVTGGISSIITLASRLAASSTKSSTTGKVAQLNTGKFGAPTGADQVYNFLENKFAPATSVFWSLFITGKDRQGKTPTLGSTLEDLFVPIPITTYKELANDPNSANILLSMIADSLGISTNTYGKK